MIPWNVHEKCHRLVLALVFMVAVSSMPSPARAMCSPCTSPAPTAAEVIAEVTAFLLLENFRMSVVDAIVSARESAKGLLNHYMKTMREIAEAAAEQDMLSKHLVSMKRMQVENMPYFTDKYCALDLSKDRLEQARVYSYEVKRTLDEELPRLGTTQTFSPTRVALSFIYRLCKSGQLRRGTPGANFTDSDFGGGLPGAWFERNRCIEDPVQAHAFLRPSTILDHSVLVPPNRAQMEVLSNPATYDPADGGAPHPQAGTPAAVWAALTDKQKLFVGAKLYCENLTMSRLVPAMLNRDQMLIPGNMASVFANLGDVATLERAKQICNAELARRTAYDFDNPDNAAWIAEIHTVHDGLGDTNKKTTNYTVGYAGRSIEEVTAFRTDPGTGLNIPGTNIVGGEPKLYISPYVKERFAYDYCNNLQAAGETESRPGNASDVTSGHLQCLKVQQAWELREVESRINFAQIAQKAGEVDKSIAPEATPIKARFDNDDAHDGVGVRQAAIDSEAVDAVIRAATLRRHRVGGVTAGAAR